jgi:hypothetical protein
MKIGDVRMKAMGRGVESKKMKKSDLIRAIQKAEGNVSCYGSGNRDCPHTDCCFMDDCMHEIRSV